MSRRNLFTLSDVDASALIYRRVRNCFYFHYDDEANEAEGKQTLETGETRRTRSGEQMPA